ncbi:MAG: PorV/PorQ family protein [bacterium]|nr:PorV/PorQ family protein [bacterium]
MRIFLIPVFLLLAISSFGSWRDKISDFCNQKEDKVGLSWLKISQGARGVAIGDGYLSVVSDPTAMWWNPTGIVRSDGLRVSFTHTQHFMEMRNEFFGVSNKRGYNAYGIAVSGLCVNEIELRSELQDSLGEFSAYDFMLIGSYARSFGKDFNMGWSLKGIYEQIYIYSALGWLIDLGASYNPYPGVWVAGTLSNLGPKIKFENKKFKTPFAWKLGVSYNWNKLLISIGTNKYKDTILRGGLGIEYKISPNFELRAGYSIRSEYKSESISAGFGVNWSGLSLDYAFKPYGLGLGVAHILTITK